MEISLPSFLAKRNQLKSTFSEIVKVHAETAKSFDVTLRPTFRKTSACWRCGKVITNEHSVWWGVGPDCAAALGLPWEDSPEQRQDVRENNTIRLYLPKSSLMDSEILALSSLVESETTEDTSAEVSTASVWVKDERLFVDAPYINKVFIDEMRALPDRKWDSKKKVNSFDASPHAFAALIEMLKKWSVIVTLDPSTDELSKTVRATQKATKKQLDAVGVESLDEIKYADINVEEYEWGLKTKPWLHQAQAIMYAAAMFGIEVKKKNV